MRTIPSSELIINDDGTIFHLHLLPSQLADVVILVGDPGRVSSVGGHFESVECSVQNREFQTITGTYKGRRMSVISTGIGTDNIDIVMTEIDALANIDFETRTIKENITRLTIVRLGTSGAIQPSIKVGDMILATTSIGFDGLLNFYAGRDEVCDLPLERAFVEHTGWSEQLAAPYFIDCDEELKDLLGDFTTAGITISAPGFYAPQGRWVRMRPMTMELNAKIESFEWQGRRVTNFEMESSALAGLARLMGHRATTICTIIAQRIALDACTDYHPFVERMIVSTLDRLAKI